MTPRAARAAMALSLALCCNCGSAPVASDEATRLDNERVLYEALQKRLEAAVAADPVVSAALARPSALVLAVRGGLIEELAGSVARQYLERVNVDLLAVKASGRGKIDKDTFLGRMKIGEWTVDVHVDQLMGSFETETPRVTLAGTDNVKVDLPVHIKEAPGRITLRFGWDSKSITNVVCKDFELIRQLQGRVLDQHHVLSGALRLSASQDELTATPVFPDRSFLMRVDLDPASWTAVEEAFRSQAVHGHCGVLIQSEKDVAQLHELASKGIKVNLPDSIFRVVRLPAGFEQSAKIAGRVVALTVRAEALRITSNTLWSSATAQIREQRTAAH